MTNAAPTRIRVKSAAPLSEFRIWAPIPPEVETIGELKDYLCENVCVIKDLDLGSSRLMLELEDYELLGESPINLLQDGDVLVIKRRMAPVSKRKAERQGLSNSQHKKRRLSTTSTSGSSSTSLSSEATSADSSVSSNTSTDGSSSSADSSVDTLQIKNTITQNNTGPATLRQSRQVQSLPVPPGLGKPSTHARNRRRKLKRQRKKRQDETSPESHDREQAGHVNQTVEESIVSDNLPFYPTSRNQDGSPSKISDKTNVARFIPPSERDSLPKNIFVTSIDVEDLTYQDYSVRRADTPVELPYHHPHHWDAIDKNWNTYSRITALTPLSAGMVVGWRAFGLNPATLTPEISLLHLGEIIEDISGNVRIAVLSRGEASFGGVVVEEEEEEEELTKLKESIISEEWRIISHI